jgi:hypothetical protein
MSLYFGEDIGGCNSNDFPNAISARDDFYSYLDPEILTETFEGITGGAPKVLTFGGDLNATLIDGSVTYPVRGSITFSIVYIHTHVNTTFNIGI